LTAAKFERGFESQGTRQAKGKASHGTLTVFVHRNGDYSREEHIAKAPRCEGKRKQESKQRPHEIEIRERESWIVKTTETIKPAPKAKQIVVGRMEMSKRRESPELVCVEPAQLPLEGVLAARGLSRIFTKAQQPTKTQEAIISVTSCDQLSSTQTGMYVHVIVVNFSHEEIQLPKATILGVAEQTSASVVADINDEVKANFNHRRKCIAELIQY
jgi:hypothetical protein